MNANELKSGWHEAKPARIPRPTYWPATMAFAITLQFWSLITSSIIGGIGTALFIVSLVGWINEIRHERREA
ncbi:MAG: hypothetical protein WCP06_08920 [Verrucomicrobiota bacterium]